VSIESERYVLLGGSGILGMALSTRFNEKIILKTSRSEINSWFGIDGLRGMDKYFASLGTNVTVINALGITDPKAPIDDLVLLNFKLPAHLAYFAQMYGFKLVTFGTIMENFSSVAAENMYVQTKRDFFLSIQEFPSKANFLHLQLHTIYGSLRAHPYMFIEQLFKALSEKRELRMSSGVQIREYHHIDDEIDAISKILNLELSGVFQVNAGNALPIKELAHGVARFFDMEHLIKHDYALNSNDAVTKLYTKEPILSEVLFREPISGVTAYLKAKMMG
jgi:nucleoside-diphosphate-sugar epimerase